MAKKGGKSDETTAEDIVYTHDDLVKFQVGYDKNWPKDTPKHMKEGEVVQMHEKVAKTLQEKGVGKIIEYLNAKRDKSLDKENKVGGPKVTTTKDSVKDAGADKAADKTADKSKDKAAE